MKKRIYIASLAIAGLLLTTSCNDLLDTPAKSAMDKQIIFSNPDLAMNAVMGIHQSFSGSLSAGLSGTSAVGTDWRRARTGGNRCGRRAVFGICRV